MNKPERIVKLVPAGRDPKDLRGRLYNQIDLLLGQLEDPDRSGRITLRERVTALIAVGRLQIMFVAMRKEKAPDDTVAGSSVRKYATAFANDARRGTKRAGSAALPKPEPEPDDAGVDSDFDDDDGSDAA
jgi:hypothetical protein